MVGERLAKGHDLDGLATDLDEILGALNDNGKGLLVLFALGS